jgi:hypothetical protein
MRAFLEQLAMQQALDAEHPDGFVLPSNSSAALQLQPTNSLFGGSFMGQRLPSVGSLSSMPSINALAGFPSISRSEAGEITLQLPRAMTPSELRSQLVGQPGGGGGLGSARHSEITPADEQPWQGDRGGA